MGGKVRSFLVILPAAAAFALLGGCQTRVPRDPAPAEAGQTAEARLPSAKEPAADPAGADQAVSTDSVEGAGGIAAVLAERRRGDYPEIELHESGFTITEQARIGSAVRTDYESAIALLRAERYDEGIAVLREIIQSAPEATAPYIDLGIAYRHTGEIELAEEALETADLLSPDNPVIQNELGILYRKTGRFAEARASYENALAVYQEFHFARRNLAVLCDLYLADFECALRNYRIYLESAGSDPEVEIWVADLANRAAE